MCIIKKKTITLLLLLFLLLLLLSQLKIILIIETYALVLKNTAPPKNAAKNVYRKKNCKKKLLVRHQKLFVHFFSAPENVKNVCFPKKRLYFYQKHIGKFSKIVSKHNLNKINYECWKKKRTKNKLFILMQFLCCTFVKA